MKRGISPLIGVVLLIVFVIAIITLIINFTKESVERSFEKSEKILEGFSSCEEAKFFVERAECGSGNNENLKKNSDLLYIDIRNEKNINFKDAFVVKFLFDDGGSETSSTLDDTRLNAYEVKLIGIYRPFEQGAITNKIYKSFNTIEIIPRVKAGNEFKFCENKKKEIEVENC